MRERDFLAGLLYFSINIIYAGSSGSVIPPAERCAPFISPHLRCTAFSVRLLGLPGLAPPRLVTCCSRCTTKFWKPAFSFLQERTVALSSLAYPGSNSAIVFLPEEASHPACLARANSVEHFSLCQILISFYFALIWKECASVVQPVPSRVEQKWVLKFQMGGFCLASLGARGRTTQCYSILRDAGHIMEARLVGNKWRQKMMQLL